MRLTLFGSKSFVVLLKNGKFPLIFFSDTEPFKCLYGVLGCFKRISSCTPLLHALQTFYPGIF